MKRNKNANNEGKIWNVIECIYDQLRYETDDTVVSDSHQLVDAHDEDCECINEQLQYETDCKSLSNSRKLVDAHYKDCDSETIRTGFSELDDLSFVFHSCDLVVIAALPSMGKMALALPMAKNIAIEQNKRVGIISLETAPKRIGMRILGALSGVDPMAAAEGWLGDAEWVEIEKGIDTLNKASEIFTTLIVNCEGLMESARKMKEIHAVECIFLVDAKIPNSCNIDMMGTMRKLVDELQIPIIILTHLPREANKGKTHRPSLKDINQYGCIDKFADRILFLHRRDYYDKLNDRLNKCKSRARLSNNFDPRVKVEIIIAKNAGLSNGVARLYCNLCCGCFENHRI